MPLGLWEVSAVVEIAMVVFLGVFVGVRIAIVCTCGISMVGLGVVVRVCMDTVSMGGFEAAIAVLGLVITTTIYLDQTPINTRIATYFLGSFSEGKSTTIHS